MSTTAFGDFSKTTIITKILSGSKLRRAGEEAQRIWRVFVHQPQTARCLVYLLLLGLFCQEIAQQYSKAADYFAKTLKLDSNQDATHYARCHDSVETLGLVLWCLESLHKLNNSLAETVKAIREAKTDLVTQITEVSSPLTCPPYEAPLLTQFSLAEGPGKRSPALEHMCKEHIGAFETKVLEVMAAAARLESRVKVNQRHGEAASAILQLNYSNNSFEQNRTIEKLTYLTIIYLPVSLVTAIFAIPETQGVIYNNMGLAWYIGALSLLAIATGAFAIFLSYLKTSWKKVVQFVSDLLSGNSKHGNILAKEPPNRDPPTPGPRKHDTFRPLPRGGTGDAGDTARKSGTLRLAVQGSNDNSDNISQEASALLPHREDVAIRQATAGRPNWTARILKRWRCLSDGGGVADDSQSTEHVQVNGMGKEDV
ncbi:hypothetical protein MMYC01_203952 [Madurella mycetomatis]|uniref:Magnesium transport protein CorA n=1 Tax=Madurella mycetomatis TaxID=100816 RepID=A0A175WAM9_9PEZI|nr:hypothetical protein MMYC01_203952 [Madurella mycetomatis]